MLKCRIQFKCGKRGRDTDPLTHTINSQNQNTKLPRNLDINVPFIPLQGNPSPRAETLQIETGHPYPLSLDPRHFPKTFYRLHWDDNWADTSDLLASVRDHGDNYLIDSLQAMDKKGDNPPNGRDYNPSEHGWSAKNTRTPLPVSQKEILYAIRAHFEERGPTTGSVFVPGIWNERSVSAVSLWDNPLDAVQEGLKFGGKEKGVRWYKVDGELLRREGTLVFCMEELLRRDRKLRRLLNGKYRQGKGELGGLRGRAYLVAGFIPGELITCSLSDTLGKKDK